jgi:hypothetical protein
MAIHVHLSDVNRHSPAGRADPSSFDADRETDDLRLKPRAAWKYMIDSHINHADEGGRR